MTLSDDSDEANALVDHFSTVFTVETHDMFIPLDTIETVNC